MPRYNSTWSSKPWTNRSGPLALAADCLAHSAVTNKAQERAIIDLIVCFRRGTIFAQSNNRSANPPRRKALSGVKPPCVSGGIFFARRRVAQTDTQAPDTQTLPPHGFPLNGPA